MGHYVLYGVASGNLASVAFWDGEAEEAETSWEFKYDESHQLTEMTDGRGGVTETEYDEEDRVTKQTDPMERVLEFKYGESGSDKTTTITEPNESTTFEKFNKAGEPLEVIKAKETGLERKTTYEYNEAYALLKATDALGHSTTFEYDSQGNQTLEKDADGNESKWTYNSTHDVETETTPRGEKTTYERDANGNVAVIERPAPGETTQEWSFEHAENGDLESATDPLGYETTFEYDSDGDLEAETDPEADKTTWTYNENGQQLTEVSPRGNEEGAEASEFETTIERDKRGRPIKVTDPLGRETKYAYDENGNLDSVTDANEHTTTYTYNADDERTEVEAANEDTTKIAYDSVGAMKSRTDGNGHTTSYEHDALGQLTEEEDPLERTTVRKYDAAGNLEETEDALERTVGYSYDKAGRLTEIDYSEEATHDIGYEYDEDGNVVKISDGTGTTSRTYDQLGRLTEVENGNGEVVEYAYDLGEEQTEIVYPNGEPVERSFDKAGRVKAITDWLGNQTSFEYNADSQIGVTSFPEGTGNVDEYGHNPAGELTEISMSHGEELLAAMFYTRDGIGQLESSEEEGFPEVPEYEYGYDARNRLTKSNGTTFGYDPANNVTKISSTTYGYDKGDQIKEASNASFEFNELGQRVKETPSGKSAISYAYDQAGNLISAESSELEKNTFKYDGTGLMATETKGASTYPMFWDSTPDLPLLIRGGQDYFIYGPDGLPFEQITVGNATYYHHDQLGSTRVITNPSGEVTGTYRYGPNGSFWKHTGTASTLMGWAGQRRLHTGTQMIYLRSRVYDPTTAQFLSRDPLAGISGEPYSYGADNPVNVADLTGLIPTEPCPCPKCKDSGPSHDPSVATREPSNSEAEEAAGKIIEEAGKAIIKNGRDRVGGARAFGTGLVIGMGAQQAVDSYLSRGTSSDSLKAGLIQTAANAYGYLGDITVAQGLLQRGSEFVRALAPVVRNAVAGAWLMVNVAATDLNVVTGLIVVPPGFQSQFVGRPPPPIY